MRLLYLYLLPVLATGLLLAGDEQGFAQWEKANPEKWTAFTKWYEANSLKLDVNHRFYRAQYD